MKFETPQEMLLLDALSLMAKDSSKSTLRSWIKNGRVQVDGTVVKIASKPILKNQIITISPKEPPVEGGIKIIYEDSHIVVIDKPAGLLSVSTAFQEEATAHAILKRKYRPKRIYVVHRLDQDTSGVMLFAFTEEALTNLKKTFEQHNIERHYAAIVEGHLEEEAGTWRSYLYEDPNYVVHETGDPVKGELAITHYTVIGKSKNHSWLDVKLETGKKNQIRAHCKSAGIPVVGDKKYGAKANPIKRLALHAWLLAFDHPITGKKMRFESPSPKSFEALVKLDDNI